MLLFHKCEDAFIHSKNCYVSLQLKQLRFEKIQVRNMQGDLYSRRTIK